MAYLKLLVRIFYPNESIQNNEAISLLLAVQLKEVCNENQGGREGDIRWA